MCPGCHSSIQVPLATDNTESLQPKVKRVSKSDYGVGKAESTSEHRRADWEKKGNEEVLAVEAKGLPWQMIIPSGLIGVALFVALLNLLGSSEQKQAEPNLVSMEAVDRQNTSISSEEVVVTYQPGRDEPRLEAYLEKVTRCEDVNGMLPLLRQVPRLADKMDAYYAEGKIPLANFKKLLTSYPNSTAKQQVFFSMELQDYSRRSGVVVMDAKGEFRLDWESFVAYGDLAWEDIAKKKPTSSTLVRAVRKEHAYYNMGFEDDEWQSFELTCLKSDKVLFGYAKRDSPLHRKLLPIGQESGPMEVTLKIRYPEGAKADNLVIIDDVVQLSWVVDYKEQ